MLSTAATLHQLAALIWVGGMFFAYVILRPVLAERSGADRVDVWHGVFRRFFWWVKGAIVVLFATGYFMISAGFGGFAGAGVHIHIMHLLALIMVVLFAWLFAGPWRALRSAKADGDGERAGKALGQMRLIVLANLSLGLLTAAVASAGGWWHGG